MVKFRILFSFIALSVLCAGSGSAATVYLNDWCFNNNGNTSVCNGGTANNQASFDATLSNHDTVANKLGSVSFNLASGQFAGVYMDYDMSSIFANDYAVVNGAKPGAVSYEITDLNNPANYDGSGNPTIWDDFGITANKFTLNDKNGAPTAGLAPNACCDVAWAMGFTNTTAQAGTVTFTVSSSAPATGFYLEELSCGNSPGCTNPASSPIYLSETFGNSGPPPPSPEPATALLVFPAAALLLALKRRKGNR